MSHSPTTEPIRLLKIDEVARTTTLHRATIYRRIKAGTFPAGRSTGGRRVVWSSPEVEDWKKQQLHPAT